MTRLSQCNLLQRSRGLFRVRLLFAAASLLALLVSLALAQIHLRFLARDLEIEAGKLQRARAELLNRRNALVSEVERLKRYETVREYAETHLGLRESPPEQVRGAILSSEAVRRWSRAGRTLAAADASERGLIDVLGEKMISFTSVSLARED